ncbi:ATP-binding protein [Saliphagus sp. GCM10025308]
MVSNLVSNAIKYSGDEIPRIEITGEKRGDRCVFSVADDGIGIDPEYVDQIFDIFNRLHSNDEFQGTGIGLSLCRKIVDHHGGDIWVDSEPGDGTTFYFTLPAAA